MRLFHAARTHARFDDEHVIAYAGLEPVLRPAERCDLDGLVDEHVAITDRLGVKAVRTATQAQASAEQARHRLAGLVAEQRTLAAARAEAREDLAEATRAAADARTQLALITGERDALREEREDLRRRLAQSEANAQAPARPDEPVER